MMDRLDIKGTLNNLNSEVVTTDHGSGKEGCIKIGTWSCFGRNIQVKINNQDVWLNRGSVIDYIRSKGVDCHLNKKWTTDPENNQNLITLFGEALKNESTSSSNQIADRSVVTDHPVQEIARNEVEDYIRDHKNSKNWNTLFQVAQGYERLGELREAFSSYVKCAKQTTVDAEKGKISFLAAKRLSKELLKSKLSENQVVDLDRKQKISKEFEELKIQVEIQEQLLIKEAEERKNLK